MNFKQTAKPSRRGDDFIIMGDDFIIMSDDDI